MSVVTEHLEGRGVAFEVIRHAQTLTTADEARAMGIAPSEVVKTLVLNTIAGRALAVVPAARRLDMRLAQHAMHDPHVRLASEEELARDFPDYELGAIPPLGALLGVPVYVDPEVMDRETVVFAAGSHTESIKVQTGDLFQDASVTVVPLSRPDRAGDADT
jgi:Ala-tRNA(Pro) deacylase